MRRSYFFVRHGQAVYQEKGFVRADHPADTDWPLSPTGILEAGRMAPAVLRFGVERVVSSKLRRARQTAAAIRAAGRVPHEHAWGALNEIHPAVIRAGHVGHAPERWSYSEGYRAAQAVRRYVARGRRPVGGWELRPIEDRILGVLHRLDELREPRIAVVSHGLWILLASLFVGGRVRYRWIGNCSVTRIDAEGRGGYRLVSFARAP